MSEARRHNEEWERQMEREAAERDAELAELAFYQGREEDERAEAVEDRYQQLRINHEANKRLIAEVTRQREFELPGWGWTAEEFINEDLDPPQPVVKGLHFEGNNTLLVAEFKTGKTTLEIGLAKALADNEPFLGKFPVDFANGRIAFLNYEMPASMFRQWLADAEIENPDRIVPLNLRGWRLPFWNDEELRRLSGWLGDNEVKFMILDPAARAWRGLVEHEGDNVQLAEFFGALDELKRIGHVPNLLISAHKPRAKEDRARGGGEIEAWPDGNWYLNKRKGGQRSLRAEGRDIWLDETDLDFDPETRHLSAGVATADAEAIQAEMEAVAAVKSHGGKVHSKSELMSAMKGRNETKRIGIKRALENGKLIKSKEGRADVYAVAE